MTDQNSQQLSTPAGWYPDPNTGTMRWWDGAAWTDHTAAAPPATPTTAMAGAPGAYEPPVSKRRGWVLPVVLVGVLVLALVAVGAVAAVRWLSNRSAVDLVTTAPDTLLGHAATDNPQLQLLAQQTEASMASSTSDLSSAESVAAAYGTGVDDLLIVGWVGTSSLLPPSTTAQMRDGILQGSGLTTDPARQQSGPGPHGGTIDCVGGTVPEAQDLPVDACTWVRDGTGMVFLVQYDRPVGQSFADMSTAVNELLVVE